MTLPVRSLLPSTWQGKADINADGANGDSCVGAFKKACRILSSDTAKKLFCDADRISKGS